MLVRRSTSCTACAAPACVASAGQPADCVRARHRGPTLSVLQNFKTSNSSFVVPVRREAQRRTGLQGLIGSSARAREAAESPREAGATLPLATVPVPPGAMNAELDAQVEQLLAPLSEARRPLRRMRACCFRMC